MEEIVQALFEDGVRQRNRSVELSKTMNAVKVPATVQAVLASRIDRLPAEEKELLQTLAVLGREFRLGLVQCVMLKPEDDLNRRVANLQMAEFIYEQPATGDIEYIFKHALTQEVANNALLVERRKQLHERAGLALESILAEQLEDDLDELASHYSRSDNAGKAVQYLRRSAVRAAQYGAHSEAIGYLTAGRAEEGIAEMRRYVSDPMVAGATLTALLLAVLAETCGKNGRVEEGLDLVSKGLATAEQTGMTCLICTSTSVISGLRESWPRRCLPCPNRPRLR
jgi:predicted ATPase